MSRFQLNNREIKSLKLYYQTQLLQDMIENSHRNGIFMMCDSFHPKERINLRGNFTEQNLKVNAIQKNTVKFLFKKNKNIKNLLDGNVVLLKPIQNLSFEEKHLKFVTNQDKMALRFVLSNGILYRIEKIIKVFNQVSENKTLIFALKILNNTKLSFLQKCLPLVIKTNYSNIIWNDRN